MERETVMALDGGDISKKCGGKGMEGMEMGHDGSLGVMAWDTICWERPSSTHAVPGRCA